MSQLYGVVCVVATSKGIKKEWATGYGDHPIRGNKSDMKLFVEHCLSQLHQAEPSEQIRNTISWEVVSVEIN